MRKFNFNDTPVKKVAEEIRDNVSSPQPAEQSMPVQELVVGEQKAVMEQLQTPALVQGEPVSYNEVLKNVGAKIPYSVYDRLERIKRQSERSGVRSDKRNIGDLIAQAIKEFVEKYDV